MKKYIGIIFWISILISLLLIFIGLRSRLTGSLGIIIISIQFVFILISLISYIMMIVNNIKNHKIGFIKGGFFGFGLLFLMEIFSYGILMRFPYEPIFKIGEYLVVMIAFFPLMRYNIVFNVPIWIITFIILGGIIFPILNKKYGNTNRITSQSESVKNL